MAFLSGDAAYIIFEKTDEEIVNMCVDALHKLFPEEVINMVLFLFLRNIGLYLLRLFLTGTRQQAGQRMHACTHTHTQMDRQLKNILPPALLWDGWRHTVLKYQTIVKFLLCLFTSSILLLVIIINCFFTYFDTVA